MHDEIIDLSLDSPPAEGQRGARPPSQAAVAPAASRQHSLWGELPSAEAGAGAIGAVDNVQLRQQRSRRSRRQHLPAVAAPNPPVQAQQAQPQQPLPAQPVQRHWPAQRRSKVEDEDGMSADELIFMGSTRWAACERIHVPHLQPNCVESSRSCAGHPDAQHFSQQMFCYDLQARRA